MAWTYFTTYLDGTKPITKAQRDEIYDVIEERASAVEGLSGAHYSASSAIRDCGLVTDLLERDAGSSPIRLDAAINAIAICFGKESILTAASFTYLGTVVNYAAGSGSAGAIFYDAAGLCSVSTGDVAAILASPLDDHRRWNLYKAALTLLKFPQITISTLSKQLKTATVDFDDGDEDTAWDAVVTAYDSAAETDATISPDSATLELSYTDFGSFRRYFINGLATTYTLAVPAIGAFSGHWSLYFCGDNPSPTMGFLTGYLHYEGGYTPFVPPLAPDAKFTVFATDGSTGSRDVKFSLVQYYSMDGSLRPGLGTDGFYGFAPLSPYASVTWSHG